MANWQRELNLADVFVPAKEGHVTVADLCGTIAKRLRLMKPFGIESIDEERDEITDDFEFLASDGSADRDEFDEAMERLYDWADTALDDKWNGRKVCWVRTF